MAHADEINVAISRQRVLQNIIDQKDKEIEALQARLEKAEAVVEAAREVTKLQSVSELLDARYRLARRLDALAADQGSAEGGCIR